MNKNIYVISALSENTLRVLQRMAGMFARHRLNIEQLNVFETNNKGTSYFNIIVHSNDKTIETLVKQLQRIIEVFEVKVTSRMPLIRENITDDNLKKAVNY